MTATDPPDPALRGIDDVDWGRLHHAHGEASDIPEALRDTIGDDPRIAEEALDHLFDTLHHQGTLYPATPPAVPFLAELALAPRTPRRAGFVELLASIATADNATVEVLSGVRAALAERAGRLPDLLDAPDPWLRHLATLLVGHLPVSHPAPLVTRLRERVTSEDDPRTQAGLVAAAARLDPDHGSTWLREETAPDRPPGSRAGALWSIAVNGLEWDQRTTTAVAAVWGNEEPPVDSEWAWAEAPFTDIVTRLCERGDTPAAARTCRDVYDSGAATTAVRAATSLARRSRSAREPVAPVIADGVAHPDPGVRRRATRAARDIPQAGHAATDPLARLVDAGRPESDRDTQDLFDTALRALISTGDTRWRAPLLTGLPAGDVPPNAIAALIETDVPCDAELLSAVRARLAALTPAFLSDGPISHQAHNELTHLVRVLWQWGAEAADALPELIPLIGSGHPAVVHALTAMGSAASDALPRLRDRCAREEERVADRQQHAEAVLAIAGDPEPLAAVADAALAAGEVAVALECRERAGAPPEPLIPTVRDLLTSGNPPDPFPRLRCAHWLFERTGDTSLPVEVVDAVLTRQHRRPWNPVNRACRLAGRIGEPAGRLTPRLRGMVTHRRTGVDASLALYRILGESAPLLTALGTRLDHNEVGSWLYDALDALGADAAPLLPRLRAMVDGDRPVKGSGTANEAIRHDMAHQERMRSYLAAWPT
ncbi:hypothetical protein [Halostreptopolyspora alba]|uniref:HEAT repeat domain-containing protein n=1 Tax=Halostreptopolyspora alba TaxID=2487137 RepID=A0A3N0E5W1_9ACTN|nr:hypothetical protein EFW17_17150 [Nocardiopsaceae bacterium YIM 96095]